VNKKTMECWNDCGETRKLNSGNPNHWSNQANGCTGADWKSSGGRREVKGIASIALILGPALDY